MGARRGWLAALLGALALLTSAAPALAGAQGSPQPAPVIGHEGRWTVAPDGRVLLGHGFNIVQKRAPFYPALFNDEDAAFLASEGFTAARIAFIWAGVEPRPGVYDDGYIRKVVNLDRILARHGINTMIEFHQDAFSEEYGGDGAPSWAVPTKPPVCGTRADVAVCGLPESGVAFQHFWDNDPAPDGVGIQTHFINAWKHVVPFLRGSTNMLGYDVLNEPLGGPKSGCGPFVPCPAHETGPLLDFYHRIIPAIRSLDPAHLIFYEPIPTLTSSKTFLPTSVSRDPRLGFSFHSYFKDCDSAFIPVAGPAQTCHLEEQQGVKAGLDYALSAGTAVNVGEFGDADNDAHLTDMVDLLDAKLLPWMEWSYNTGVGNFAPGLLLNDSKHGSESNAREGRLDALAVPRPQVVAGTPTSYSYDRGTHTMTFTYGAKAAGPAPLAAGAVTRVFVPSRQYRTGYRVQVRGASVAATSRPAFVDLVAKRGQASVTVTISPLAGRPTTTLPGLGPPATPDSPGTYEPASQTVDVPPATSGAAAQPPLTGQAGTGSPSAATPSVADSASDAVTRAADSSSARRTFGTALALALVLALLIYWTEGFGAGAWRAGRPASTQLPVSEAPMTQPDLPELVRHEVRRQLAAAKGAYRRGPAAIAALLALVVLVPDARTGSIASSLDGPAAGQPVIPESTTGGSVPGTTGAVTTPGTTGGNTAPGTTGTTGIVAPTPTPTTTTGGGGTGTSTTGTTTGAVQTSQGTARNGTKCGPGVRQFSFVPYSPMCVPKFSGDNGGATAHGVTRTSITLVLRNPTDYDAGRAAVAASSFAAALHDAEVLVKVFNSQFELYGRQLVLKSFTGTGSFIAEAAGQDQAGANADAQKAYDLGAFVSGIPPDPQVYQDALSSRGVISFGLGAQVTAASARKAYPYQFQSLGPIPDFQSVGVADLVCGRMAKMPAIFAGDPLLAKKTRTFGLVLSQQAATAQGGTNQVPGLVKKQCGQTVSTYTYQGSPASNASDASSIATRAKADGVTSLILVSDLLFAPNMTNAAVQQSYQPEWLVPTLNRNQTARQMNATAVKSMVFMHPWKAQSYPANKASCYRIYKMGDPGGEPQSDQIAGATFDSNCSMLLELFGALQAAGPRLTPATFGQGFFTLPSSNGTGDFGKWSYDKDHYSPDSTYTLQYWRPGAANPYDNGTGLYVDCREAADQPYVGKKAGTGQLRCLGK